MDLWPHTVWARVPGAVDPSTTDAYNNSGELPPTVTEIHKCSVQPGPGAQLTDTGDTVVINHRVLIRHTIPRVPDNAMVALDGPAGPWFDIHGPVRVWEGFGAVDHQELDLTMATGEGHP